MDGEAAQSSRSGHALAEIIQCRNLDTEDATFSEDGQVAAARAALAQQSHAIERRRPECIPTVNSS